MQVEAGGIGNNRMQVEVGGIGNDAYKDFVSRVLVFGVENAFESTHHRRAVEIHRAEGS
jgi:hypothetical protein